ncbi:helix-turn-helix domain-containing protein [Gilvimarinus algae]|uniref:Helix-turn-helix transcriptional regulator n=1 Tax=Gilvimarinus algae TaxID=3058037 RepID=A0ABT8TD31_9GAMM|nr:helix-turn-helix transcriptional regulator [Gilvimarinus sp. SDUM040014]MDO3382009.1 helix-turn-helix transcriptional regulator [Gilvimarinus sp. SDUM040014]
MSKHEGTIMRADKRKKLEAAGWVVDDASDFLGLTPEESAYTEMKIGLGNALRERRKSQRISQVAFSKRVKSSQSRVANIESGDPSVSIDALTKSLLALGVSSAELSQIICSAGSRAA